MTQTQEKVSADKKEHRPVWSSGFCYLRKLLTLFGRKVKDSAYPGHVESLWILITLVTGLHFAGIPYGLMQYLSKFKILTDATIGWQIVICMKVAFVYWLILCRLLRYTLKFLLMYKGFMHEERGKSVSLRTKIWAVLLKGFIKWNPPSLYSFQESLPRQPVPKLNETISRYLRSIRPLVTENEYQTIAHQAAEFENKIGNKLQRYLVLKSWWAPNYVSDFWEEYVYLRNRSSIMINSNYYICDYFERKTKSQSARAANVVHLAFQVRSKLERHEIKPMMAQGFVPLCSQQYRRVFNTFREPGIETDRVVHFDESQHVVIFYNGRFYKLAVFHKGKLLEPQQLQLQIDQILNENANATVGEKNLASLTSWNRTKWAEARRKYFSGGINKTSLDIIEGAAFFLALDNEPFGMSYDCKSERLGNQARKLLHGNGNNRWFDKSFTFVITSDAQLGLNVEHSWADGPVMAQIFEEILYADFFSYDEFGNIKGTISSNSSKPPAPIRLLWDLNPELLKDIDDAYNDALKMIEEVDHRVIVHKAFGKGFIKTCNLSPDAFIQMALQLANYREFNKFTLTYEASMTRLYRDGRTETVRSCSTESSAWVKAMENGSSTCAEKISLLQNACKKHQVCYIDAMNSRGVDRHLFCLYIMSRYFDIESPFLQQAVSEPWRLSTSQGPHGQTPKYNFKKHPGLLGPGAGFGPVAYDGYAVSYIISGEDMISFHVSCNRSCSLTDSSRFIERIVQAMADIRTLFEDFNSK